MGGKAKALMETARAGFNVPEGFVLSVEFFAPWTGAVMDTKAWHAFLAEPNEQACQALRESARLLRFTPEQRAALDAQLDHIPAGAVFAVRSSSPEEDLGQASFAGQYETFLGVKVADLESCIAAAFASMLAFRVVQYKRRHDLAIDNPRIAVICQRQIAPDVSGVAFSLNPNNNAFDEAVINASFGLGEAIVSGQVTPDTYIVDKVAGSILDKKIASKSIGVWPKEDGGTVERPNPAPERPALTDAQILEVAALAAGCEKHYGRPMDIEWAIEDATLYLLQARPITTYNPLFGEMITAPGAPKYLYLDLNIATQGFFDPISELGLDVWSRMLLVVKQGTMPKGFDGFYFDVGGREYIHISNMVKALGTRVFPKMLGIMDADTAEVLNSVDLKREYTSPTGSKKMKSAVRRMIWLYVRSVPAAVKAILNPDRATAKLDRSLESSYRFYTQDLLRRGTFRDSVERGMAEFERTTSASFGGVGVYLSALLAMRRLNKMFKGEGVEELVGLLGAASPTNPTAKMGRQMLELASSPEVQHTATEQQFADKLSDSAYSDAFMTAYTHYMERFGARGFREIDIAVPRTSERPQAFFRQLKALDIAHNNATILAQRKDAAYQQLLELAAKRGFQRRFTRTAARYTTQIGFRESWKYLFVVLIGELRKEALDLGQRFTEQGRLDSINEIFDLTVDQVGAAETDPHLDLRALRERNLRPRRAVAHVRDWPKIVDSRGKIFRHVATGAEGELAGHGISAGVVTGRAKVLASPYQKPLENGEILVTRATEPAWTPIFMNAAGVVLEVGGLLQHGAIIAREYNLPAVSGISRVTDLIQDGDLLEVDGTNGRVRILEEAPR
ncbi:MAG: hypothetical protein K0U84_24705 [Actinomycetia bacterium]|nr:hypothetical protein [Actinomycetes bacterium]